MRVEFFLYPPQERASGNKKFFEFFSWPVATPQIGWKISFALRTKESIGNAEVVKTGVVMDAQVHQEQAKVWMDMGEFAESIRNGTVEATRWTGAIPIKE